MWKDKNTWEVKLFSPIRYNPGNLKLIDQRVLPLETTWLSYQDLESAAVAIEEMVVRGAPAIGCTAAFGLAVDIYNAYNSNKDSKWLNYKEQFYLACDRLSKTRPTAVNLFAAINEIKEVAQTFDDTTPLSKAYNLVENKAMEIFEKDQQTCLQIGENSLSLVEDGEKVTVLTHCNAGALATAGYGTALGVIRSLHKASKLKHVYADETRPYLQGARLTVYELLEENIPCTLNTDSAAAYIMSEKKVDMIVVGADRIAANGDTANKVGTYMLAILAKHHGIPFYIAAPLSTFDLSIQSGAEIPIEMRTTKEISHFNNKQVTPNGLDIINPSFDVTPNELITGIITEKKVLKPPFKEDIRTIAGQ